MKVPTGTPLDELLQGGIETDAVTTIYGPPGIGKTTFAIHAVIEQAKRSKKTVYVDTEGGFSVERLKQLCKNYKKVLDSMIFFKPSTFEEQKKVISQLKSIKSASLIVIDTIGMLYRVEKRPGEYDINRELNAQVQLLNEICRKKQIPILITNQVYDNFATGKTTMIGGDIIRYVSKCLIELSHDRKAILHKHRSIARGSVGYKITETGIGADSSGK